MSLVGSYAYVNASFDKYEVLSNDAGRIAEIGRSQVVESGAGRAPNCLLVYTRNSPGLQPEHQLSLTASWDAPLSALNWFDYQTATFQPNILAFLPTPRTLGIRASFRF